MGSGTIAYYLMQQQAARINGASYAINSNDNTNNGHTSVPPCTPRQYLATSIDAFVSLDMPPLTARQMSPILHAELAEMIAAMEGVDLSRISDFHSAHEEFVRCGMTDVRVRGLYSTNLIIERNNNDISNGMGSSGKAVAARWKCNLPALHRASDDYTLFLPDGFRDNSSAFSFPIARTTPVLSILGGDSPIGGQSEVQAMWPAFSQELKQHVVPGATHTVFYDKQTETADLVTHFLRCLGIFS